MTPVLHQRPGWPDLHWDATLLARPLAAARHAQGRLLGRLESQGFPIRAEAKLETLTADLVRSWAIEGEPLDADQVRSSIASRLGLDAGGLPRADRDVDGVVEMMLDATQSFGAPLTAERLKAWHAALFPTGRSGLRRITVGDWRPASAGPMQVVSGPVGRERLHFEAPEAARLGAEMDAFLEWFESDDGADPVLKAGAAHLRLLTIHPFEDGNGRIARAVLDLSLARADGTAQRYYSLSTQIEAERRAYYDELEAAQRGGVDATRWLEWFLGCLHRSVDRAGERLARVLHKAHVWDRLNRAPVNERQRKVVNRLTGDFHGKLTTSKYAKLADCSQDTALRDVRDLIERGVLVQNPAGGRSTSYRLVEPDELRSDEAQ